MYKITCLLALSLLTSATLVAQVHPSAEGVGGDSMWVGAEISTFNPDYGCLHASPFTCWNHQLLGFSPYADTRRMFYSRISAEGQARFLHWRGPGSLTESSYMAGPRVALYQFRQITLNGKLLAGYARLTVPKNYVGSGTYFAYAPGVLVDYKVSPRLIVRADYEQQFWPNFKGIRTATTDGTGGLTPNGLSIGVSYALR